MKHWRTLLARIPLPMLALAASYGVYSFATLFVPWQVAVIQAAAFELCYIGLAVTLDLSVQARKRATTISIGAVVASIIYNTLSGWFYRQPQLLEQASPLAWLALAILHGAPLAWVAYLVSDLLLHSGSAGVPDVPPAAEAPVHTVKPLSPTLVVDSPAPVVESAPLSKSARVKELAIVHQISESTAWRKVKAGELSLNGNGKEH